MCKERLFIETAFIFLEGDAFYEGKSECESVRERETERETERQRERQRERDRDRETDRERNLPSLIKRMRWIVFFFLKHSENDKLGKIN